jgi:hypothetical protein
MGQAPPPEPAEPYEPSRGPPVRGEPPRDAPRSETPARSRGPGEGPPPGSKLSYAQELQQQMAMKKERQEREKKVAGHHAVSHV